jgi:hypothetical protein
MNLSQHTQVYRKRKLFKKINNLRVGFSSLWKTDRLAYYAEKEKEKLLNFAPTIRENRLTKDK